MQRSAPEAPSWPAIDRRRGGRDRRHLIDLTSPRPDRRASPGPAQRALLARISHELRTPLTSVVGFLELLTNREIPADAAEAWYPDMLASSRQLARIVEMLEFSAALDGPLHLRREVMDVDDLVRAELESCRPAPGPRVTWVGAPGGASVLGDPRWLQRCIHELIDNACKFCPPDGDVLVTTARTRLSDREGVTVDVADSGPGMSDAELARAFDQFVQGDSSETRSFGGLGLGLTMVRRVVDAHGGSITATSTKERGTTLSMWLPADPNGPSSGEPIARTD